jgi:hypothetical protein
MSTEQITNPILWTECDHPRCPAQAYVFIDGIPLRMGTEKLMLGQLAFCKHHYEANAKSFRSYVIHDYREHIDEGTRRMRSGK